MEIDGISEASLSMKLLRVLVPKTAGVGDTEVDL